VKWTFKFESNQQFNPVILDITIVAFRNSANTPKNRKPVVNTLTVECRGQLADSAHRHVATHVTVYVSVGACALARDILDGLLRSGASPSPLKVDVVHSLQHTHRVGE